MSIFNPTGNAPSFPRSPQIPQLPFGFGLSTITDFIGLTDPAPIPIRQPVPIRPQAYQHQQQYQVSSSPTLQERNNSQSYQPEHRPTQYATETGAFGNQFSSTVSMVTPHPTRERPLVNSQTSDDSRSGIPMQFPIPDLHNTKTINLSPFNNQYESQISQLHYSQATSVPSTPTSSFSYLSSANIEPELISSSLGNSSSAAATSSPTSHTLAVPSVSNETTVHDLTRRSASPTSSGVQIDLINLRQKLSRDIENNMETVTGQQKRVKDLQSRADIMEAEYAHLKGSMEDLKRKQREQQGKLKEIDSLVKSALTMSSFSSATSLHVELIEAENENDTTVVVIAAE